MHYLRLGLTGFLALVIVFLTLPHEGNAVDKSLTTTVSVTTSVIFAMEFYTDEKVIYSTTVPFSNIDPSQSMAYPNGREEDDGKSDTGVVCISNVGEPWYLKIQGTFSEGLPKNSVKYYYSKPWNRNSGQESDGTLANNIEWRAVPDTPATLYASGAGDEINTPFGTLSTFSFAVDPRSLSSDQVYTVSITYTMTTAA